MAPLVKHYDISKLLGEQLLPACHTLARLLNTSMRMLHNKDHPAIVNLPLNVWLSSLLTVFPPESKLQDI